VAFRGEWEHYWVDDGTSETMNVDVLSASVLDCF
jgi:hypothetical protein